MTRRMITDVSDQTLIFTIDKPEIRNALDADAHGELAGVFDRFERDPALHVAIITGSGTQVFCAGSEIRDDLDLARTPLSRFAGLSRRLLLFKPVIAAVNEIAFGGSVEIQLARIGPGNWPCALHITDAARWACGYRRRHTATRAAHPL
jgi:enoyl-CoA hydratase/carnithine racemase